MSQLARTLDRHRSAPSEQNPDLRRAREGASMWRVAWQQHRKPMLLVLTTLGFAVVGLVAYRWSLLADLRAAGCDPAASEPCFDAQGRSIWDPFTEQYPYRTIWSLVTVAMGPLPIIVGALAGAALFVREFGHGTRVLALTQSVSRRR